MSPTLDEVLALMGAGEWTVAELAAARGRKVSATHAVLVRLEALGAVRRTGKCPVTGSRRWSYTWAATGNRPAQPVTAVRCVREVLARRGAASTSELVRATGYVRSAVCKALRLVGQRVEQPRRQCDPVLYRLREGT